MAAKGSSETDTHPQINEPNHGAEANESGIVSTQQETETEQIAASDKHTQLGESNHLTEATNNARADHASSVRISQRNVNKVKVENFQAKTDAQSQYHELMLREIQSTAVNTNYDRLAQVKTELEKSIAEIHTEYTKLNDELSGAPKPIGLEVDRLTHDNRNLVDKVEELMSHLSAKLCNGNEPQKAYSLNSRSTRTSTSGTSTNSSSSSKLRRKAHEARAAEEAKRAELRMLAIQEELETELAELKLQQELQLTKKQQEIKRAKLQGEITAEQIKRQVLELAATEEEVEATSSLRLPTPKAPSMVLISPETQTDAQVHRATKSSEPVRLKATRANFNLTTSDHEVQHTTDQQQSTPLPSLHSHLQEMQIDNPQRQPTPNSEHSSLAGAIVEAINYANEHPKLKVPKPFIYTGKLTDYPDWKTSVNRFILDRKGRPEDKLALLRTYLSTDHHKLINAYCTVGNENALKEALEALDEEFGDEFQVGKAYKQELYQWPQVAANDPQALKEYLGFLKQCSAAMVKVASLRELNTLSEQQKIIKKLPVHLGRKWIHKTTKYHESHGEWPNLSDLCTFLKYEVKVACNPLNDTDNNKKGERRNKETDKSRSRGTCHAIESKTTPNKGKHCIKCEKQNHFTSDCGFLVRMSEEDKQQFIASNNLCFYCLNTGHGYRECKTPIKCQVPGCKEGHATVNHSKIKNNKKDNQQAQSKPSQPSQTVQLKNEQPKPLKTADATETNATEPTSRNTQSKEAACHSIRSAEESMSMFIMPVYVGYKGSSKELLTYALVDSMSDRSFISENLVNKLNVSSSDTVEQSMMLHTMTQQTEVTNKQIQGLKLRGYKKQYTVKLPSMTTTATEIPINKGHIPTQEAANKWKHLRHISDELPPLMDIDVGILLGANVNAAHTPLEVIVNTPEEPYAKRTVLGWSITGNHQANTDQTNKCFTHRIITKEVQDDNLLRKEVVFAPDSSVPTPQQILNILESDFQPTNETTGLSIDDKLYLSILTKETYQDEKDLEHSGATKQLHKLHPFVDSDGLLRVGGRLKYGHHLEYGEKHPIILPKDPITMPLVRHYHVLTGQ